METNEDLEKEYPGWINPKRKRSLYELILFDKYNRWFPLWFVKLYLTIDWIKSDFWDFMYCLLYRLTLIISPLILIGTLTVIILLIKKQLQL